MLGSNSKQNLFSSGNETFDRFLGGGLLNSSLNLFERHGPQSRILDAIVNKSFVTSTLTRKQSVIYVNFNSSQTINVSDLFASLPVSRMVTSESMYRDIREKSSVAKIKIAWRYSQRGTSSPSDVIARVNQVDFGASLLKCTDSTDLGELRVINVTENDTMGIVFSKLTKEINDLKKAYHESKITYPSVSIIIKDILHPFSTLVNGEKDFFQFIYAFRCLSRTLDTGYISICYDSSLCTDYSSIEQNLYNLADCVVSFYSYETDENKITGYKDIDGTLNYIKVPKINSFGYHFQQDLSDWCYRLTKNFRYFVIDELSLPPCEDEEGKGRQCASEITKISNSRQPLQQVGPLEELRDVAKDVLANKL